MDGRLFCSKFILFTLRFDKVSPLKYFKINYILNVKFAKNMIANILINFYCSRNELVTEMLFDNIPAPFRLLI
jgi:hypothetical protein